MAGLCRLRPIGMGLDHVQRRHPLGMAVRLRQAGIDQKPVAVLHQPMSHKAELGLLGQRMLARVICDMRSWKDQGLDFGSVAINVSAPEFVHGNYAANVLESLRSAQLHPSMFEIEVTETVFLDDGLDSVETALTELHRNGVSIALDDFGTGYASLTHLSKFPVSWLKIDRSFVSGLGVDPDATAIVKAVMGLSHNMGIGVVAEGIETEAQWKQLRKEGCDLAQGYLISKPICAEHVAAFLKNWSGICSTAPTSRPQLRDAMQR